MNILVIGGGGYVGSALCPYLQDHGHSVTAYDLFLYGPHVLPASINKVSGDIRDINKLKEALIGQDAVIHLACISNDPSFNLNPELGKSINLDSFPPICEAIKEAKIKHFIYASSSSVYGIHHGDVTEETECSPLTDYSKFKLQCEEHLKSKDMGETKWTIVRPATVHGYAPRLRLDLVVNALTISALVKKKITLHGGPQLRPNVHIDDLCKAYSLILNAESSLVHKKVFNAGSENASLGQIASYVQKRISNKQNQVAVEVQETNDLRSYHINSKLLNKTLGWLPEKRIHNGIMELKEAYRYLVDPLNNSQYFNIKKMKELGL